MRDETRPSVTVVVASAIAALALLVVPEARRLPPGYYEPLGSGTVPQATAGLVFLSALAVGVPALVHLWRERPALRRPSLRAFDAFLVSLATVAYVAAMEARLSGFAVVTALYLMATIGWLVRFQRRQLPWVILVAGVTGYGCQYIFTRVLVVDLPGL